MFDSAGALTAVRVRSANRATALSTLSVFTSVQMHKHGHMRVPNPGTWGRCSAQLNQDGDSDGDACDRCPKTPIDNFTNSNLFAEDWKSVTNLEDPCDPVPLYIQQDKSPSSSASAVLNLSTVSFTASTWLGNSEDPTDPVATSLNVTVQFGHCSCHLKQNTNPAPTYPWMPCARSWPPVRPHKCSRSPPVCGRSPPLPRTLRTSTTAHPSPTPRASGTPCRFNWNWVSDATAGRPKSMRSHPRGATRRPVGFAYETLGMLGTFVLAEGQHFRQQSGQEQLPNPKRREAVRYPSSRIRSAVVLAPFNPMILAGVAPWAGARDIIQSIINEWEHPEPGSLVGYHRSGTAGSSGGVIQFHNPEVDLDVSNFVSPGVAQVISNPGDWAWLMPSESRSIIAVSGGLAAVRCLPTSTNMTASADRAQFSGGTMMLSSEVHNNNYDDNNINNVAGQVGFAQPSRRLWPSTPNYGVKIPDGGRAVFLGAGPGGVPHRRRVQWPAKPSGAVFDFATSQVRQVAAAAHDQPGETVLAAAYDRARHTIYVVDQFTTAEHCQVPATVKARATAMVPAPAHDSWPMTWWRTPRVCCSSNCRTSATRAARALAIGEDGYVILVTGDSPQLHIVENQPVQLLSAVRRCAHGPRHGRRPTLGRRNRPGAARGKQRQTEPRVACSILIPLGALMRASLIRVMGLALAAAGFGGPAACASSCGSSSAAPGRYGRRS